MSLSLGGGAEDGEKYNNKKTSPEREREGHREREREREREIEREREGACVDAVCN